MRTFGIAILVFFTLAPAVLAAGSSDGVACTAASQCSGGFCVGRDSEGIGVCASSAGVTSAGTQSGGTVTSAGTNNVTLVNPLGAGATLSTLVTDVLNFVIRIGAIVIIFILTYVGYLFVAARGNATKISDARRALLWTIVGALILLGAQAISLGIQATVQALSVGS